ncbi:30S ribosomal protein S16 [Thermincola ferriacetica]|uniref:Small ribosomal subunit protein bS16 n=2 Tax=Thermincola TaxID=278993 RepID=D5X8L9_THEPJ|nr:MULTISPECIES: 30S ribosomal protein S16 [Thermincola]ADG82895.1 ribosomal protein S16 [Thermincola potens JR]KNZ69627.1 30S ribosomal protein S16 [Thermincola ferriacetica]
MATRIRLRRMGAKKNPFYRIVVADKRAPRDGAFIEEIGYYNPLKDPAVIEVNKEKAVEWLNKGAQPSDTVRSLFTKVGIINK